MAKKILYAGTDGIIKELTSGSGTSATYYDEVTDTLVAKNVSFNTMSFNASNGLPIVSGNTMTLKVPELYNVVAWDNINKSWTFIPGTDINISNVGITASANSDLTGTFGVDEKVKSLSNVKKGTLSVQRGGTGLNSSSYTNNNEALLLGNSTNAFTFLTASQNSSAVALVSNGTTWDYITQSLNNSVETTSYITTGSHIWTMPSGTKAIRVLVQGGGGGGGSGANRRDLQLALGGTGGGAGAYVDSGMILVDPTFTNIPITVGSGGIGGTFPNTNSSGVNGNNGQSSSFGTYIIAPGGNGGIGGNYSSVTSSGGTSTSGSSLLYNNFTYNTTINKQNKSGSNNTSLYTKYSLTSSKGYGAGDGSGGGNSSLSTNLFYNENNIDLSSANILYGFEGSNDTSNNRVIHQTGSAIISTTKSAVGSKSGYWPSTSTPTSGFNCTRTALGTGNFTIEAFIYPEAFPVANAHKPIFDFRNGDGSADGGWLLTINGDSKLQFWTNQERYNLVSNSTIELNKWTHIAYIRTSTNFLSLYINGKLDKIFNISSTLLDTSTTLWIGYAGYSPFAGRYWEGYIDEIKIHNSALPNLSYTYNRDIDSYGLGGTVQPVTESLDVGTLALAHFNITDPIKDNSLYNNSTVTGSFSSVINSPVGVGLPSSSMTDGVLSCSYNATAENLTGSFKIFNALDMGTLPFTAEAWFYLINTGSNTTTNQACHLMSIGSSPIITISPTGLLMFYNPGSTPRNSFFYITGSNLNKWNHIAYVRTSASGSTIYLNGANSLNLTTAQSPYSGDVYVGSYNNQFNPNGYIKEFRLTNRALSSPEIISSYNSRQQYSDPTPIQNTYLGYSGLDGLSGSGGGGGGASTNATGSTVGTIQGGKGADGYVTVISYKY